MEFLAWNFDQYLWNTSQISPKFAGGGIQTHSSYYSAIFSSVVTQISVGISACGGEYYDIMEICQVMELQLAPSNFKNSTPF